MGIEIERKFLVRKELWTPPASGTRFRQGYLCLDPERTVRVRLAGETGYLTIKGRTQNGARAEFEYPIPPQEARDLLDRLCLRPLIEKVRYRIKVDTHLWEVDKFFGENDGLLLAEVELSDFAEKVELPNWVGREVTDDPRYYNASLIRQPFRGWAESG